MKEIAVVEEIVDMAIAGGMFKNRQQASQAIHCMGIVSDLAKRGLQERPVDQSLKNEPKHKGS